MVRAAQKGEGAASPEVAKVAGEISKKDAKDFAKTKHKGLPEKKKVQEDLATDAEKHRVPRGPGGNPIRIKDKVASMKSTHPLGQLKVKHGADKVREYYKKNKAQSESLNHKDVKKLNKASVLDQSDDPKDWESARARRTEVDYKDLVRQINKKKKPMKPAVESFKIDKSAHKAAQKKSKMRNLAKGNTNPNEKAAAQKKAGGPKLYGEGMVQLLLGNKKKKGRSKRDQAELDRAQAYIKKNPNFGKKKKVEEGHEGEELKEYSPNVTYQAKGGKKSGKLGKSSVYSLRGKDESKKEFRKSQVKDIKGGYLKTEEVVSEGKTFDAWKKAAASALGRKKEERKPQKATDAGARAKRMLQRKVHAKYVSGSTENVPDEMRD